MRREFDEDEWITIRTCATGSEAELLRSVLAGSDIEAFIPDEYIATVHPGVILGEGVRLQVRAGDRQRAEEVLASKE